MTHQQNRTVSKLAKSWARLADFLDAMDPDPHMCTNNQIGRLRDDVACLGSRLEQLESKIAEHY